MLLAGSGPRRRACAQAGADQPTRKSESLWHSINPKSADSERTRLFGTAERRPSLRVLVHKPFMFRLSVATAATGSLPVSTASNIVRFRTTNLLIHFFLETKLLTSKLKASSSVRVHWHDPNRRPRFGVSGHWHLGLQHQCLPKFLKVGSTGRPSDAVFATSTSSVLHCVAPQAGGRGIVDHGRPLGVSLDELTT